MTTLALARVEARRLLAHPSVAVGVLLAVLGYWLIHLDRAAPALFDPDTSFGFTLPLVLLAWSVMVGVTMAVLRSRREGTDELLESLPAEPATRTAAHLLSVWVVVPLALVILALASVLAHAVMPGAIGWVPPSRTISALLILVGAGASAVLLARWIPVAVMAPVGIIATVVLQANLRYKDVHLRWLHFSPGTEYASPFDFRHDEWHVAYLIGLIALAYTLSIARHGFTRRVLMAGVTALAVIVGAGWVQTRPPGEAALAAQADRILHPVDHQACQLRADVRYCAYPGYGGWVPLWARPVAGVIESLPPEVRARSLVVRQYARPGITVAPDLARRIEDGVWPSDGGVHPAFEWTASRHDLSLAYQVGAWSTGLPGVLGPGGHACSAGGQARVVVAMWLAAQASPNASREARRRAARLVADGLPALLRLQPLDAVETYDEDTGIGPLYEEELASAGRGTDLVATTALLDLPRDRVKTALGDHWGELVDPATPSSRLFDVLGVAMPGVAAGLPAVTPGLGRACT